MTSPEKIPPPPWRCVRQGCPEPVTSWARDDFAGHCSEGCRDLVEDSPAAPNAVPLCPLCLGKIGGATGAPDFPYRAAEDFERCGAADCDGPAPEEDPYVCRVCGHNDPRTVEVGEAYTRPVLDLGAPEDSADFIDFPDGVEDSDTEWETVGAYCPSCMAEMRVGTGAGEVADLREAFRWIFCLRSRHPREVAP